MDSSKINQTELSYSCGAGDAKLNLYTGRLALEYQLCSIGIKTYGLTLSNIYNSHFGLPSNINTHLGENWKLNIQQYVYMEDGKYYYIDGSGMIIEFECLSINTYYDKSGLGLKLTTNSNSGLLTINDVLNNEMIFQNGKLIKTISSENINVAKIYDYDENERISKIYDARKPDSKILFEYNEDDLLCSVNVYVKNNLKYKYKYCYENNKLVSINKEQDGFNKPLLLYKYQNNLLRYAVYVENKSAFKFKYSGNKVTTVNVGVADLENDYKTETKYNVGDDIYVGENVYPNEIIAREKYKINECMETYGADVIKLNEISYNTNYRLVTNEMNLKFVYFLNEKGYTTSILEANGTSDYMNDLRTLERMPGIRMLEIEEGESNEKINKQKSLTISTNTKLLYDKDHREDKFKSLKDYREHDCANYKNFVCSFWLKVVSNLNNNKVKLTITSCEDDEPAIVSFDKTAVNSWQEVRIPIQIKKNVIENIQLEFLENESSKYVKIADMKLYDSGTNQLMIGNKSQNHPIDKVIEVIYNQTNIIGQEKTIVINDDNYVTEKDLQMTYLNRFKKSVNNDYDEYYPFFYNDCTKFIMVKYVSLKVDEQNVYPLNFIQDTLEDEIVYGRANYFIKSYSPDSDYFTNQITYFLNSYMIDNIEYACMVQKTEANLYESGNSHKSSYLLNCTDLKGKVLMEQDEYGVQNIYKYDIFGEISETIKASKTGAERIIESASYSNNVQNINDGKIISKIYYDDNDNIYKSEYRGVNESSNNILCNEFEYNYFNEKAQCVKNNFGSQNIIRYDNYGRICEVSPQKENQTNYYGYRFKYDNFGDPQKFLFLYKRDNDNKFIENLLIDRVKKRNSSETIIDTDLYIEENKSVRITNVIDKYGRNKKTVNDGKMVNFEYDDLDESQGTANICKMYDEEDSPENEEHIREHYYNYNEDNNLIEYGYTNNINSDYFNIKKISENSSLYKFNNYNEFSSEYEVQVDVTNDSEKLISPRIISDSSKFEKQPFSNDVSYEYDDLGRLNKKKMDLCHRWEIYGGSTYQPAIANIVKNISFESGKDLYKSFNTISTHYDYQVGDIENYKIDITLDYDGKYNLNKNNYVFSIPNRTDYNVEENNNSYYYNSVSQLEKEVYSFVDQSNSSNNYTRTIEYLYNSDGSLDSVKENGINKNYKYQNGRLSKIIENNIELPLTYDNLGNTLTFGGNTYTYKRGNLLKSFNDGLTNVNYYYNGQGKKYKKELSNGLKVTYVYDGEKLISEKHNDGKELLYLYDMNGIYGFVLSYGDNNGTGGECYYFEKDAMGNVVAITTGYEIVAKYTYDAFGNCLITNYENPNLPDNNIGNLNPIRWKGMYCEVESDLYFLKNNTYSPKLRQTLSMNYLDEIVNNSYSLYNLYSYNIYSTNPVVISYEDFTSQSSLQLTYQEKKKSKIKRLWESLWNRWWGKAIAIALTALAILLTWYIAPCTLPALIFTLGITTATLVVGGILAGIQSENQGKGFWNGFANHINDNWAQTLAVEMATYLVSFGITQALGLGTKCFIEGTLILTSVGLVKIEDIKVGDKVWSYNEKTNKKELKRVKKLFRNKTNEWLHLTILNENTKKEEEIICTKDHRIYIKNKGWIPAYKIVANDEIILYNNFSGKVVEIQLKKLEHYETTYNFEVEENHNYYVGEECVLVHNECHHIISNKGKKGDDIKSLITEKFGDIDLNEEFNLVHIKEHRGRHTNDYHDMVKKVVKNTVDKTNDIDVVKNTIKKLGKEIYDSPDCLKKGGSDLCEQIKNKFINK